MAAVGLRGAGGTGEPLVPLVLVLVARAILASQTAGGGPCRSWSVNPIVGPPGHESS